MSTQLGYTYAAAARIMHASGYTDDEIRDFLVKNQNPSGYILASDLPPIKKINQ